MPVGKAHGQGGRILAGVGRMNLMVGNLGLGTAPRETDALRTARALRKAGGLEGHKGQGRQGVRGYRHDEAPSGQGGPQPVQVLMTRQVVRFQGRAHLGADSTVVRSERGGGGQKPLEFGPGRHGRGHLGRLARPGRRRRIGGRTA